MKTWYVCLMAMAVLFGDSQPGYAEESVSESSAPGIESSIRAGYWGITASDQAEQHLQLLALYGFNTAIVNDSRYALKTALWKEWGDLAAKYDLNLLVSLIFAGTDEKSVLKENFRPYVAPDGTTLKATPCPLDEHYWDRSIGQRFQEIARISQQTSISGLVFDAEMYGSEISSYREPCFCDHCWHIFTHANSLPALRQTLPERRMSILKDQDLVDQYAATQEKHIQTILASVRHQVHKINPTLQLGFLGFRDNWFYRGLIRGLGTEAQPAYVFSESTYIQGFTQFALQERDAVMSVRNDFDRPSGPTNNRPLAHYIPGLWLGRFYPEDLAAQAYQLANSSNGYWIFTPYSLWTNSALTGPYTLHGDPEEYWMAFQQANQILQHYRDNPSQALSEQVFSVEQSSFYDPSQKRLLTQPALNELLHDLSLYLEAEAQAKLSKQIVYRDKTLFHVFNNPFINQDRHKRKHLRITHVPLGNYTDSTRYMVFDHTGQMMREGLLDMTSSSITLSFQDQKAGMFSLLTDSGANLATIAFSGMPFVIEASSTFPLWTFETEHTYWLPLAPTQKALRLRAYCSSVEESAQITIHPSQHDNGHQAEIVEYTEMRIPVSAHHFPSFAEIRIAQSPPKQLQDVRFYFYDEKLPYLVLK